MHLAAPELSCVDGETPVEVRESSGGGVTGVKRS